MLAILIFLATLFGFLFYSFGLPPLVGFLLAGFIFNLTELKPPEGLNIVADLGVYLLLFCIGLKVKIKNLARKDVLIITTSNISVNVIIIVGLFILFSKASGVTNNLNYLEYLILGVALSFSSTVFAVKTFEDRGELTALYSILVVGILILQDLLAALILAVAEGSYPNMYGLLLFLFYPLRSTLYKLLNWIGHDELLVLFGFFLSLVIGVSLFEIFGIKGELGALFMGMLIANHKKADELGKSLFSIKEFFLVGFFLSIGINGTLSYSVLILGTLLLLTLPIRFLLYFFSFVFFRFRARTALFSSLSLATFSEFGLVVIGIAVSSGMLDSSWLVVMAIAISFSFLISAPLNKHSESIYEKYKDKLLLMQSKFLKKEDDVGNVKDAKILVIGMGRVGTGAYDEYRQTFDDQVLGVEQNTDKVLMHLEMDRNVVIGDANDIDFWSNLVGKDLDTIILAMPEHNSNLDAAIQIKNMGISVSVLAVARFDEEVHELESLGVKAFNIYSEAGVGLAKHGQSLI